jgi:hypothetical protein
MGFPLVTKVDRATRQRLSCLPVELRVRRDLYLAHQKLMHRGGSLQR